MTTRVEAHVLIDDLRYMTIGSSVLRLPGLRSIVMPTVQDCEARAVCLFEATCGELDPDLIRSECERMGARAVYVVALSQTEPHDA